MAFHEPETFRFDPAFHERLLALMIRDKEFFLANRTLVKEEYFQWQSFRDIFHVAEAYFQQYGECMDSVVARNEITSFESGKKVKDVTLDEYYGHLDAIYAMDLTGQEYARSQIIRFAKRQALKAVNENLTNDLVTYKEDYEKVFGDFSKALQIGISTNNILDKLPTFNDLDPDKEVEWLIEGLIPAKAITAIYGKTGTGKTHVIYLMGKCRLEDTDFFGLKTQQGPVYYLDYENPEDVRCHVVKICGRSAVTMWALDSPVGPPPKLDQEGWEILKGFPPGLIIVDSFRACQLKDTTKDKDAAEIMDRLKQLWACGHTIIIILHTMKDEEKKWKGNQVVMDLSDNCLALFPVPEIGSEEEIEHEDDMNAPKLLYFGNLKGEKSRYGKKKIYLRYDPQKEIVLAESPMRKKLLQIHSKFWEWRKEKEKELGRKLTMDDCPNKENFEALLQKWGFKDPRKLINLGKTEGLWEEDVNDKRQGRPHYFYPTLITS